mmetsp:Transcript_43707/g.107262  ORF Transcript_43707/g.107262 Transcript_43707/m.107262 type:complete len:279 (-) Transcript_43707:893-1729(-)
MLRIRHPNVIQLYDVFVEDMRLYLVIEMLKGGELFDLMAETGSFSEQRARDVMQQVLLGLEELHSNGIVHRDLKPENLLCTRSEWPFEIKISDFGMAKMVTDCASVPITGMAGTVAFMAPEIVEGEPYTSSVDIWAAGCILYMMLSGRMPFPGMTEDEVFDQIRKKLKFEGDIWEKDVSRAARNIVRKMMDHKSATRLSAQGALRHVWMHDAYLSDINLPYDAEQLAAFRRPDSLHLTSRSLQRSKSKREQAKVIVRRLFGRTAAIDVRSIAVSPQFS